LWKVINAIKDLESILTDYRQEINIENQEITENIQETDLDKHFELKDKQEQEVSKELQNQVEQPSK
jgi:hypothetical protein